MPLTPQDVGRIAHLARLELQADEQAAMLGQLNGFFRIVEQMSAVDTRGVEPLYTPLSAVQAVALRLRDDAVTEGDERARNQVSAPVVEDGLFLVPKVIE
jgi:aspartyl-tRNA(Asn)/glutamyl-tRNA(Gln) amidotransferase subunit C